MFYFGYMVNIRKVEHDYYYYNNMSVTDSEALLQEIRFWVVSRSFFCFVFLVLENLFCLLI